MNTTKLYIILMYLLISVYTIAFIACDTPKEKNTEKTKVSKFWLIGGSDGGEEERRMEF